MKRNSIKTYLLVSLSVLGLASCTDLEIEETDSFISEGFQGLVDPNSSLDALYGQTYGQLGDQANTFALHEVTSDAFLIPTRGADWGDNGRWRKLHQHEWGLEETDIITPFQQWTSAQLLASRILDSRSNADAATTASAHFLRAYAMWLTLDFYGQVPFRDTALPDSELPTVLTGGDAVTFILADLDAAIAGTPSFAPGDVDNLRLASKSAARFLKARVLLNKHIYENQLSGGGGSASSADMAEVISLVDAIAAEGFALETMDYFEIFRSTPDTETIWWAQAGVGNRIFNGLHYNSTGLGGGGWNGFSTLAEYYDMFEGDANANEYDTDRNPISGQERRRGGVPKNGIPFTGVDGTSDEGGFENGSNVGEGFLLGQQYALDGTPLTDRQGTPLEFSREFVDGNGAVSLINNSERTGIRVMKYNPRFDGGFQNNQVIFRYADAHLMKAEAMMRSGGDPTAMVNELRTLRGATPLGSVSEADLLEERGRELYAEQTRRFDMIRFGQYLRDWELKGTGQAGNTTRLLFPIPLPQLLANPNLVQNAGY
ncbi:RagB/SusD family nutrient uptake outer membrane protein [Croceivirga thetidis]|uniref:RagB/SusD family nutrient uptake outer membrane protein n=1 Tax=Croceivirga thetidis TaxID=2721623 RepID=A0ABX1GNX3_9FLAO|nr:RagB/SusD family nutrient uptake outer membrane protein [Croceivirga thetidis]NKI31625.1 RagB/SusD family nutrient uptake outer membrane protein [Croceivirga thetidis]